MKIRASLYEKFGDEFLDQVLDWVGDNCEPDEVFDSRMLERWIRDQGWVLPPDDYPEREL